MKTQLASHCCFVNKPDVVSLMLGTEGDYKCYEMNEKIALSLAFSIIGVLAPSIKDNIHVLIDNPDFGIQTRRGRNVAEEMPTSHSIDRVPDSNLGKLHISATPGDDLNTAMNKLLELTLGKKAFKHDTDLVDRYVEGKWKKPAPKRTKKSQPKGS